MSAVIEALVASGKLPDAARTAPVEILDTKSIEHGDYASNFALLATKATGIPPRAIGETLRDALLETNADVFAEIDVAGPGFLNFKLRPEAVGAWVGRILELGADLPRSEAVHPLRINLEFVSVNPNGPITVGSGRGAAFGSTLGNVLDAAGHQVHREYYINDGVNSEQMRLFAESVLHYCREAAGQDSSFPEKGYRGEYVQAVAKQIGEECGAARVSSGELSLESIRERSQQLMIERQRTDLASFGVWFDTWFSEQSLHDRGEVSRLIEELGAKGAADEKPERTVLKMARGGVIEAVERVDQPNEEVDEEFGEEDVTEGGSASGATLWLRATKFGDDMDRVLRRKDGRLTYIASDVAYHADKFHRGSPPDENGHTQPADKLLTILGPDHHGYIARLHAVLAALLESPVSSSPGAPLSEIEAEIYRSPAERDASLAALETAREKLEVVIFQIVRFLKDGTPAPMRKRDGNIYELRDLISELGAAVAPNSDAAEQQRIGKDVARFFYLTRSHDTHMDFDIDLATKQSDENPVFYVQYAHARICGVLRKAEGMFAGSAVYSLLTDTRETSLIKKILDLPFEVQRCASDFGVHRLTTYCVELARAFHHFYDSCRVIQNDQPDLSRARLALCRAAQVALASALRLLEVSAPDRMDRAESMA